MSEGKLFHNYASAMFFMIFIVHLCHLICNAIATVTCLLEAT